ncbi:hypothetical protein ACJX0J_023385, partial [Zea mays]
HVLLFMLTWLTIRQVASSHDIAQFITVDEGGERLCILTIYLAPWFYNTIYLFCAQLNEIYICAQCTTNIYSHFGITLFGDSNLEDQEMARKRNGNTREHGRGGQSALRFARLRMEKRHNYNGFNQAI